MIPMSEADEWGKFRRHLEEAQKEMGKALYVSNSSKAIPLEVHNDVKELQTMLERLLRSMV